MSIIPGSMVTLATRKTQESVKLNRLSLTRDKPVVVSRGASLPLGYDKSLEIGVY